MSNVNQNTGILNSLIETINACNPIVQTGVVTRVTGLLVESLGPNVSVGNICIIKTRYPGLEKAAEVVGINENKILLMPFEDTNGIGIGCIVETAGEMLQVPVGMGLLGRVVDGFGRPLDGKGPIKADTTGYLHNVPPPALSRPRITRPLATGIRSIDSMITAGEGQRVGIFAGSGVGKSVLLGMIARNSEADVNVIALIGERGREVKEFIDGILGEAGLRRSVVVVVTSDQAAVLRVRGAQTATTIAEYFRDQGKKVILMMDSVTRVAMAQREIGLAIGEPPTTKGYTPSVYALLPRLLERAGMASKGSITGFYTVLVESDDMNDPVADTVRSILDGHMVLARRLAEQNHYPAVDILQSVSRVMNDIIDEKHLAASVKTRDVLATYQEAEDLINIGAYVKGNNPKIDFAINHIEKVRTFLRQKQYERADYKQTVTMLKSIFQL
ncbi:MAG TPA: flagellar protein export ATPase FliI [bacterium]|nr:flagellar protein export ATPase FliI [bacterium]HPN43170.1 flagellar protein export ATPase FliI [bacterium]